MDFINLTKKLGDFFGQKMLNTDRVWVSTKNLDLMIKKRLRVLENFHF